MRTSSRSSSRGAADDPVSLYARRVVAGKVVAGRLVRLACQRHLDDLRFGHARGLSFDRAAAERAIRFFRFLKHSKGEWAGSRFDLELWQQFKVGSLLGWKRDDETRRFRQAFIALGRKNGKSTEAAGFGIFLCVADGEPGAEVYTAATKRDQARLVHSEAVRMVRRSPALRKWVRIFKDNLSVEETGSKFEPLGADADTLDGLNVHGALIDELHAHKTRDMVDVLETATGARRQPLIFEITTAPVAGESICNEHWDYSVQVLEGTIQDDAWFAYIACIDEGDDWADPKVWPKANPNLGVSVKLDDLRRQCEKAKQIPAAQNTFLRLRCNVRTQQVTRWIDLDLWDANAGVVDAEALRGRTFYGGLDLGAVRDLTAWLLVFPRQDDPEEVDVLARFWCPEARLTDTANLYRAQYQAWARLGLLRTTPGTATDYAAVKAQVLADPAAFRLGDIAVDRLFQAHQLSMEIADELGRDKVLGMGQGFISMAAPTKELERRLLLRKVHHGGNPVLRWMAGNVVVKQDPAGNLKVDKAKSTAPVDGIVALIMGLDRAMRHEEKRSVYEDRDLRFL